MEAIGETPAAIKRLEDPPLLTGRGRYVDDVVRAGCYAARAAGKRSWVHAHAASAVRAAAEAGCFAVTHGSMVTDAELKLMAERGTFFEPNIGLVSQNYLENRARYLGIGNYDEQGFRYMEEGIPRKLDMFRRALKTPGLRIIMGTDATAGAHGQNAREIVYRVNVAGQDAMSAIVAATVSYYGHFIETYKDARRIRAQTTTAAPAAPDRHEWLIELMEGVEDIPGAALSEGLRWGWNDFAGFLEDHTAVALGFLALYELTFDSTWLTRARMLGDATVAAFWDEAANVFFDTAHDHERLITRPREVTDNATPAGTSLAVELLLRLAELHRDADMLRRATWTLEAVEGNKTRFTISMVFDTKAEYDKVVKFAVPGGEQTLKRLDLFVKGEVIPFFITRKLDAPEHTTSISRPISFASSCSISTIGSPNTASSVFVPKRNLHQRQHGSIILLTAFKSQQVIIRATLARGKLATGQGPRVVNRAATRASVEERAVAVGELRQRGTAAELSRMQQPHFAVFPEFVNASYAKRYEILLMRLLRERLYDGACLLLTSRDGGIRGKFTSPTDELSFQTFAAGLSAHALAYARTH